MKKKKTLGTIKREKCKRLNFNPSLVSKMELKESRHEGKRCFTLIIRYGNLLTPFSQIGFCRNSSSKMLAIKLRHLADAIDGTTQRKNDSKSG